MSAISGHGAGMQIDTCFFRPIYFFSIINHCVKQKNAIFPALSFKAPTAPDKYLANDVFINLSLKEEFTRSNFKKIRIHIREMKIHMQFPYYRF